MAKIIKDTREQKGWEFDELDGGCAVATLKTGDYTVEGLEHLLCVERKGTFGEFAGNLTEKRFWNEMDRMRTYPYAYIICEFELKDIVQYPYNMGPLKDKIKVNGAFLLKKILEIELMGIRVVFAGKYGKQFVLSLIKRVAESV